MTNALPAQIAVDAALLRAAEQVWAQVCPLWPQFSVEVLPEVDSSNSELMRRARARNLAPTLLVAQRQNAGRGRMGRHWAGEPGASLMFSMGLPLAPADWSGLSLAVGVAVAESLHASIGLKWPNDLWLHERKLAGILVETASVGTERYAVVGVGLNILPPPSQGLSQPAAGLCECIPGATPASALAALALPLAQALQLFESEGFAPFAPRFAARDVLRGRLVRASDSPDCGGLQGQCLGVDSVGALLVHTSTGPQALTSAQVSVRPV